MRERYLMIFFFFSDFLMNKYKPSEVNFDCYGFFLFISIVNVLFFFSVLAFVANVFVFIWNNVAD